MMTRPADTSGTHVWLVMMKAFRVMRVHAERSLGGTDMCFSDFAILETLLSRGPQPVNTIGQRIDLTSGAVTTAVDRLEARGLVTRRLDPNDRRARIVTLTPDGKRRIHAIFGPHKEAMDRLGDALTKSERATLIELIKKLGRAAQERLDEERPNDGGKP